MRTSLTKKLLRLTWHSRLLRNFNLFRAEGPKVMHLRLV
jgi:hypothetical protein